MSALKDKIVSLGGLDYFNKNVMQPHQSSLTTVAEVLALMQQWINATESRLETIDTTLGGLSLIDMTYNGIDYQMLGRVKPPPTWADGTWEEISKALTQHKAGTIDLYNTPGWEIGATRTVPLSAMAATGVGESHVAQDVEFVLMDKNVVNLNAGGKCNFVIGMKNSLADGTTLEGGYMNASATNSGGWRNCARRTWCNNVFANAVPAGLKGIVKNASIKSGAGNGSTTINTTTDRWFLPCTYNVFGGEGRNYTSGEDTIQWEWYKTGANRFKRAGASGSKKGWWLRSPRTDRTDTFSEVYRSGNGNPIDSASAGGAIVNNGLAPHACI